MPPLPESERARRRFRRYVAQISRRARARARCRRCSRGAQGPRERRRCRPARCCASSLVTLLPAIVFVVLMGLTWHALTKPDVVDRHVRAGADGRAVARRPTTSGAAVSPSRRAGGLQEPPSEGGLQEPPRENGVPEPPADGALQEPRATARRTRCRSAEVDAAAASRPPRAAPTWERLPAPTGFWIALGIGVAALGVFYAMLTFARLRGLQDAAGVVLPARGADPRGARLDRVRAGDADRSGGGGLVRRLRAGGRLRAAERSRPSNAGGS